MAWSAWHEKKILMKRKVGVDANGAKAVSDRNCPYVVAFVLARAVSCEAESTPVLGRITYTVHLLTSGKKNRQKATKKTVCPFLVRLVDRTN